MENVIKILKGYSPIEFILLIIILILAIKEIITLYEWFKEKISALYNKHKDDEEKEDDRDSVINDLKEKTTKNTESIVELKEICLKLIEDSKKRTVASTRNSLYRIYNDIKFQGRDYLNQIEYETFYDLAEVYLDCEGNHTMKDKIIPYIKSLPVLTDEELRERAKSQEEV